MRVLPGRYRDSSKERTGREESSLTEEEQMRHEAITQYLDAEADLHKAQALLDDLEATSGGHAALAAKVAELKRAAIKTAITDNPECEEAQMPEAMPPWNGRGVLWTVILSSLLWAGLFLAVRWV